MCNKNLMLESLLKVNRPSEFIETRNFDFALLRGGGVDSYLKSDF